MDQKKFPENYPDDVVQIIRTMSFPRDPVKIIGSASQISQLYSVDYDMNQEVHRKSIDEIVRGLQKIVRDLLDMPNVTIGDIKCGIKLNWVVIPEVAHVKNGKVLQYNKQSAINNVRAMHEILTEQEKRDAISLLKRSDTPSGFLEAKQSIRPHLIRWTPKEILQGYVTLRTGERYTLADGIQSPSISKLDVIAFVNGAYTDFSIIYYFFLGKKQINAVLSDPIHDISQNLFYYWSQQNYFKALKRLYSLTKLKGDTELQQKLQSILNSDLGILYSVIGDLQTLQYLIENKGHIMDRNLSNEMENIRVRLGNVGIKDFLRKDDTILDRIRNIEETPSTLQKELQTLINMFEQILQRSTKVVIMREDIEKDIQKYLP